MYRVFVDQLEFYGYHGVPPEERKIGHRYQASVTIEVEGTATKTDRVEDTIDYAKVAQVVELVSSSNQFSTLERLAQVTCEALLAHFHLAIAVHIRLSKPLPPAEMIAAAAGVDLEVRRV